MRTTSRRSALGVTVPAVTQFVRSRVNVETSLQLLGAWLASKSTRVGTMGGGSCASAVLERKTPHTTVVTKKIRRADDFFVILLRSYPTSS